MPAITQVFRAEITRLAKKEARGLVEPARKSATAARREVTALKRRVEQLERALAALQKNARAGKAAAASASAEKSLRFRPQGVRAHRDRLGLSAEDFGRLLGVSSQAIYNWEQGTARPRPAMLDKFATLRSIGKREALARLKSLNGSSAG